VKRSELRRVVEGRLAHLGYHRQHSEWNPRKAVITVMVGVDLVEYYFPTRLSKRNRDRELSKIPRRGPPRPVPIAMKDDGGGVLKRTFQGFGIGGRASVVS
jgi:hypothetical protein